MNCFIERSAHPSRDQILGLLEFLEKNPSLAKGFSKVPSARAAARKQWEKIAVRLNGIGGSRKSWKQWTKYWADKKSAVKKKASLSAMARRKGDPEQIIELSDIEERILSMMVGGFASRDRHMRIQQIEENTSSDVTVGVHERVQQSEEPLEKNEIMDPLDISMSSDDNQSCLAEISCASNRSNYVPVSISSPTADVAAASPFQNETQFQNKISPEPPLIKSEPSLLRRTIPRRLRRVVRVPTSPPSQWQTQFSSLTDRLLSMEEQRLELDRKHTDILEAVSDLMRQLIRRDMERERILAQAITSVGDGLKLLAKSLEK